MGVADVLAGAGVEGPSREVVLEVVERLVSRLHIVQREKDTATDQIRGEKPFDKGGGGGGEKQRELQVAFVKVWWLVLILIFYSAFIHSITFIHRRTRRGSSPSICTSHFKGKQMNEIQYLNIWGSQSIPVSSQQIRPDPFSNTHTLPSNHWQLITYSVILIILVSF
jgi:hypothetical protein